MDRLRALVLAGILMLAGLCAAQAQVCGTVSNCPPASTPYSGAELLYMVQNGQSKKSTIGNLASYIFNSGVPINLNNGLITVFGGSAIRTLSVKLADYKTIEDFRLTSDPAGDDTQVVARALASGAQIGCQKSYTLKGLALVTLPASGIFLDGSGDQQCQFLLAPAPSGYGYSGGAASVTAAGGGYLRYEAAAINVPAGQCDVTPRIEITQVTGSNGIYGGIANAVVWNGGHCSTPLSGAYAVLPGEREGPGSGALTLTPSTLTASGTTVTATVPSTAALANGNLLLLTKQSNTTFSGTYPIVVVDATHFTYTTSIAPVGTTTGGFAVLQGSGAMVTLTANGSVVSYPPAGIKIIGTIPPTNPNQTTPQITMRGFGIVPTTGVIPAAGINIEMVDNSGGKTAPVALLQDITTMGGSTACNIMGVRLVNAALSTLTDVRYTGCGAYGPSLRGSRAVSFESTSTSTTTNYFSRVSAFSVDIGLFIEGSVQQGNFVDHLEAVGVNTGAFVAPSDGACGEFRVTHSDFNARGTAIQIDNCPQSTVDHVFTTFLYQTPDQEPSSYGIYNRSVYGTTNWLMVDHFLAEPPQGTGHSYEGIFIDNLAGLGGNTQLVGLFNNEFHNMNTDIHTYKANYVTADGNAHVQIVAGGYAYLQDGSCNLSIGLDEEWFQTPESNKLSNVNGSCPPSITTPSSISAPSFFVTPLTGIAEIVMWSKDPGTDNGRWSQYVDSAGNFHFRTTNDAGSSQTAVFDITRSGSTVVNMKFDEPISTTQATISAAQPTDLLLQDTAASANAKTWDFLTDNIGTLSLRAIDDTSGTITALTVPRSGGVPQLLNVLMPFKPLAKTVATLPTCAPATNQGTQVEVTDSTTTTPAGTTPTGGGTHTVVVICDGPSSTWRF